MAIDILELGKTQAVAITGADGHVDIGGNWQAVAINSSCDCHLTFNGSAATTASFKLPANTIMVIGVQPGADANGPGGGSVHFIKATGATDGTIWITEAI
jgi:hypothetical protein